MEAKRTYTQSFYLVCYFLHSNKEKWVVLERIRRHIPIGLDKNVKKSFHLHYLELFDIRILRQVRKKLSLEYGPYSVFEFHIQYSFLKAPIRAHFHIISLYAKLDSQIWLFEVWYSNIRTQPGISNTIV